MKKPRFRVYIDYETMAGARREAISEPLVFAQACTLADEYRVCGHKVQVRRVRGAAMVAPSGESGGQRVFN